MGTVVLDEVCKSPTCASALVGAGGAVLAQGTEHRLRQAAAASKPHGIDRVHPHIIAIMRLLKLYGFEARGLKSVEILGARERAPREKGHAAIIQHAP